MEGLKAAAARAFDADPAGVTAYGTSVGYLPLRKWIADKHGVCADQVIVTNGSLQADAFLFDHLVQRRRRRGRGEADVRPHPAQPAEPGRQGAPGHARARTASTSTSCASCSSRACGRSWRTSFPNYQNPAGVHAVAGEAPGAARAWPSSTASRSSRTTRTSTSGSAASRCRRCCRWTPTSVVVHASSFTKTVCPGVRVGYLVGPAALIDAIAKKATNLYISPGMVSEAIVHQFCVSGDIERSVRTVSTALAERAARAAPRCASTSPGDLHRARRRLLPLGGPAGGRRTSTSCLPGGHQARRRRSSRAATSCSTAASTRCAWRTPASPSTRSTRASSGWLRLCTRCRLRGPSAAPRLD